MKLNIELNQHDLEKLYKLYTINLAEFQRTNMPHTIFELNCDQCGSQWELSYIVEDDSNEPMYCPFCGVDVDLSDIDDEPLDNASDEIDFGNWNS